MDYSNWSPQKVRELIRRGEITTQTSGMCLEYAQANLVVLPQELAYDFLLFVQRNPKSCPLLEVSNVGSKSLSYLGKDVNIAKDIPLYRIYRDGILCGEFSDVEEYWRDDFVSFFIGCSFSFEFDLLNAGIAIRHIEENCNVPMYITNIECEPAGIFHGNMVVSMRPIHYTQVVKAVTITNDMPRVHGAPIHIGSPKLIGIKDITLPDFGHAVTIKEDEIPVFWPCGVTPQSVVMNVKPSIVITHAPGHMFITDIRNADLK